MFVALYMLQLFIYTPRFILYIRPKCHIAIGSGLFFLSFFYFLYTLSFIIYTPEVSYCYRIWTFFSLSFLYTLRFIIYTPKVSYCYRIWAFFSLSFLYTLRFILHIRPKCHIAIGSGLFFSLFYIRSVL